MSVSNLFIVDGADLETFSLSISDFTETGAPYQVAEVPFLFNSFIKNLTINMFNVTAIHSSLILSTSAYASVVAKHITVSQTGKSGNLIDLSLSQDLFFNASDISTSESQGQSLLIVKGSNIEKSQDTSPAYFINFENIASQNSSYKFLIITTPDDSNLSPNITTRFSNITCTSFNGSLLEASVPLTLTVENVAVTNGNPSSSFINFTSNSNKSSDVKISNLSLVGLDYGRQSKNIPIHLQIAK